MSRRKQANPRPVKSVLEGRVGHGDEETGGEETPAVSLVSHGDQPSPQSPSYYAEEEKPLTIDTSFNQDEDEDNDNLSPNPPSPRMPVDHDSPLLGTPESSIRGDYFLPRSESSSPSDPSLSIPSSIYSASSFAFPDPRVVKRGSKVSDDLKILPVTGKDGESRFVCPVCNSEMKNHHDLTVHIRQHNSQAINSTSANQCRICNKTLSSQSSLDRHMLVHSGERPFACRICKMSFTTNGNMHRHMRIHSKEAELGMMPGAKSNARRSRGGWQTKPKTPMQNLDLSIQDNVSGFPQEGPASYGYPPVPTRDMSQYSPGKRPMPPQDNWESPSPPKKTLISHQLAQIQTPSMHPTAHHPANRTNTLNVMPDKVAAAEEEAETQHCPVCDKEMPHSDLVAHMDTHASVSVSCVTCHMTLRDPQTLLKHTLEHHPETKVKDEPADSTDSVAEPAEISVGFHDLDFIDFTCPKFSLVAKSYCENFTRQPSSEFHNFECKFCRKSFPTKSALLLHTHSHTDKQLTSCPFCQCEFVDQDIMQAHMMKHMADKNIEDTQTTDPHSLSQQNFLAGFSLAPKQLVGGKESQAKKIVKDEKRENNEYFPKLGHAYAPSTPIQMVQPMMEANNHKINLFKQVTDLARNFPQVATAMYPKDRMPQYIPFDITKLPPQFLHLPYLALLQQHGVPSPMSSRSVTPPPATTMQAESPFPAASPTSTPPLWDEGQGDAEVKGKGIFPCKYCDMVFTNQRSLKGHTRSHLGLSPYKCNLCDYSSADKSTLVRHLRTHNGERPFQCLICDFAFTTKANCERHVRKKHAKAMKDEIEQSIGYNKYVMDTTANLDAFHSPDTICKYCGVDFKFFRALKHHLRSHSSCRQKPFLCRKCHVGFSTKANCVRHIQKQHQDVSQHDIETMIHVNEPSMLDEMDRIANDDRDSTSPASQAGSSHFQVSPSPPAAHRVEPNSMFDKLEHIPVTCTQPLDFTFGGSPFTSTPGHGRGDQPMDLSVKKRSPSPTSTMSSPNEEAFLKSQEQLARFLKFSSSTLSHLRQKQSEDILALSDSNNNDMPSVGTKHRQISMKPKQIFSTTGTDSSSDLASVNNILNNTASHKFNMFLGQSSDLDPQDKMATLRQHLLKKDSPVELSKTSATDLQKDSTISLLKHESPIIVKQEVDSDMIESNGKLSDSKTAESKPTESDVSVLAMSYREEADDQVEGEEQREEEDQEEEETESKEGGNNEEEDESGFMDGSKFEEEEFDQDKESKNSLSPVYSMMKGDKFETPVKKKRNSYADSPHKLRCKFCPRSFPWVSSLNRHLLTHTGQKPFKCPRCPVTFSTKSNRERHLIRKHGVNMLDPASRQTMDRPYKCHLCVFSSFSTESNLLKHYHERHNGIKPEPVPDMDADMPENMDNSFSDEEEMSVKSHDTSRRTSPPESGSEDHSQSDYTAFLQYNTHDLDPQGEGQEDEDGDEYVDDSVPFDSGERQINPERDNYNVDKITNCWKCGKGFQSRKILVRHLKEHNIDLAFKCYLCDASFDHRKECLYHQEKNHARDWAVLREKNAVDDIDVFSVKMDQVVERHCRLGNGVVEENDEEEDEHAEAVTSDYTQRKVYCSLCPKRFWSLQDLRRHMRSHTGERPFECNVCHKRFTLKHSMMRHRKKHTAGSMSPAGSDDEDALHAADLTNGRGRSSLRFHLNTSTKDSPLSLVSEGASASMVMSNMLRGSDNHDDNDDDILQNLLGVDKSAINTMLDSADSAAQMLGVK